jgi:hypothetical protein
MAPLKFTVTPGVIKPIAEQLDIGCRVFLHRSSGAICTFVDRENFMDLDDGSEAILQQFMKHESAGYVEVERWSTQEAFEMMADFAEQIEGEPVLQQRLTAALNKPKPFRNFKFVIDNAGPPRQQWFAFKNARQEGYVEKRLEWLLKDEEHH